MSHCATWLFIHLTNACLQFPMWKVVETLGIGLSWLDLGFSLPSIVDTLLSLHCYIRPFLCFLMCSDVTSLNWKSVSQSQFIYLFKAHFKHVLWSIVLLERVGIFSSSCCEVRTAGYIFHGNGFSFNLWGNLWVLQDTYTEEMVMCPFIIVKRVSWDWIWATNMFSSCWAKALAPGHMWHTNCILSSDHHKSMSKPWKWHHLDSPPLQSWCPLSFNQQIACCSTYINI